MIDSYKPTWLLEAIYHVTPEQLKKHHIKGILTDLDNTLIAWDNPHGTEELLNWLLACKMRVSQWWLFQITMSNVWQKHLKNLI